MSLPPVFIRCPMCQQSFKRRYVGQRACGFRCARRLAGQTIKARGAVSIKAANAIRLARIKTHIEASIVSRFGELSVREIQVFNAGVKVGYRRGYNAAYTRKRAMGSAA